MPAPTIINRNSGIVAQQAWARVIDLDNALYRAGFVRSDAGQPPADKIAILSIGNMSTQDLDEACAALALHRAILTVMSCDLRAQPAHTVAKALNLVPVTCALHSEFLALEMSRAMNGAIDASPPEDVFQYEQGFVEQLLLSSLTIIRDVSVEQIAVTCDLAKLDRFPDELVGRVRIEPLLAKGARTVDSRVPAKLRNPVAWYQRNPSAEEERLERYLRPYDLTPEAFIVALEEIAAAA